MAKGKYSEKGFFMGKMYIINTKKLGGRRKFFRSVFTNLGGLLNFTMPSNEDFSFSIMVGDTVLPEYYRDGIHYVESCLFTPFSYRQRSSELIDEELETQNWPVTPYTIKLEGRSSQQYFYKVLVDGHCVTNIVLSGRQSYTSDGFRDGNLVREFLFALPRFAKSEDDRVDKQKEDKVGRIVVQCYEATVDGEGRSIRSHLDYRQANKKDCKSVTRGQHLMSTTKVGRTVRSTGVIFGNTTYWNLGAMKSDLVVRYLSRDTLENMGFVVHKIPFKVEVPKEIPVIELSDGEEEKCRGKEEKAAKRKLHAKITEASKCKEMVPLFPKRPKVEKVEVKTEPGFSALKGNSWSIDLTGPASATPSTSSCSLVPFNAGETGNEVVRSLNFGDRVATQTGSRKACKVRERPDGDLQVEILQWAEYRLSNKESQGGSEKEFEDSRDVKPQIQLPKLNIEEEIEIEDSDEEDLLPCLSDIMEMNS